MEPLRHKEFSSKNSPIEGLAACCGFPGLVIPLHGKGILALPSAMPPRKELFVICLTYKIFVC